MEIQPAHTQEFIDWVQEKYADTVYRIALLKTNRKETAAYVYQKIFLHLIQKKESFDSEEHLKIWLIRSTVRRIRFFFLFHRTPFKNEIPYDRTNGGMVLSAVTALPQKDRIVVLLHDMEVYSVLEIAGLLHQKDSAIRSRLAHAQSKLEEAMANVPYGYRLEDVFQSIQAPRELKQNTAEKMLDLKARKSPALKYAAFSALAVFVAFFCILVPAIESKRSSLIGQDTNSSSQGTDNSSQGTESKSIAPAPNDIQITLIPVDQYKTSDSGTVGGGEGSTRYEQFDFNLHCTGYNIKKVTYTAHNCEFMKKIFFTQEQVDSGEAFEDTEGSITGISLEDGSTVHWGFSPIGYVYSADYMEQVNLANFGLKVTYVEKNAKEFEPFTQEEFAKVNRLKTEAYAKASIIAEIKLENGEVVHKIVKPIPSIGIEDVSIRVEG